MVDKLFGDALQVCDDGQVLTWYTKSTKQPNIEKQPEELGKKKALFISVFDLGYSLKKNGYRVCIDEKKYDAIVTNKNTIYN